MRIKQWIFSIFLVWGSCVFADDFRTFTSTQGQEVQARLLGVEPDGKRVRIQTSDGKKAVVNTSIFSLEDEMYIQDWLKAQEKISELSVSFRFDEKTFSEAKTVYDTRSDKYSEGDCWGMADKSVTGHFILKNTSDAQIEHVRLEYFYLMEGTEEYRIPGEFSDVSIAPGDECELTGKDCPLTQNYHYVWERDDSGNSKREESCVGEDQFRGAWVRVYSAFGKRDAAFRDVYIPETLTKDCSWNEWSATNALHAVQGPSTLEEFNARGKARNKEQYERWYQQITSKGSRGVISVVNPDLSNILRVFYDPAFDSNAENALEMAYRCQRDKWYSEAIYWYETALPKNMKNDKDFKEERVELIYIGLTGIYASAPDENVHDGKKAIKYAQLLLKSDSKCGAYLDLLSQAYARDGQFEQAEETIQKAIKLKLKPYQRDENTPLDEVRSPPMNLLDDLEERLELYQKKRAYSAPSLPLPEDIKARDFFERL